MFKRLLSTSLCLVLAGMPSLTRAQGVPRTAPIERASRPWPGLLVEVGTTLLSLTVVT